MTELPTEVKILTISQNSFDLTEKPVDAQIAEAAVDLGDMRPKTVVKEVEKQTDHLLLTDAEIVVSGGRGMKTPENWAPIEELAALLNGATACSRPVSDEAGDRTKSIPGRPVRSLHPTSISPSAYRGHTAPGRGKRFQVHHRHQ